MFCEFQNIINVRVPTYPFIFYVSSKNFVVLLILEEKQKSLCSNILNYNLPTTCVR